MFASLLLGRQLRYIAATLGVSMYRLIMEVWHLLHAAEEVVRAGVKSFVHQVEKAQAGCSYKTPTA